MVAVCGGPVATDDDSNEICANASRLFKHMVIDHCEEFAKQLWAFVLSEARVVPGETVLKRSGVRGQKHAIQQSLKVVKMNDIFKVSSQTGISRGRKNLTMKMTQIVHAIV